MADAKAAENAISMKEFLEDTPPGTTKSVSDLIYYDSQAGQLLLTLPKLSLHCETSELCDGPRQFQYQTKVNVSRGVLREAFVSYICQNCTASRKTFALRLRVENGSEYSGIAFKFGETPNFGPPTPARLTRLFGTNKDLFLKGRRAENQGMGIAAFAYYRRVIESQKDAIFDEIIRVSRGISAAPDIIARLESAKKQVQFTSAVEELKDGLPPALLINGHNPLILMHGALSEGLHAKTDEECLGWATDLRVVMADFVERMAQAMKDNAELQSAVSRLMNRKQNATAGA